MSMKTAQSSVIAFTTTHDTRAVPLKTKPEKLQGGAGSEVPTINPSASIARVNQLRERARALREEAFAILDGGVLTLLEQEIGPI